jgi:hypothetical protein
MNGLRMVWYSSEEGLLCRWEDAEETETRQTVLAPIASPAVPAVPAVIPGRTEFAARRAA